MIKRKKYVRKNALENVLFGCYNSKYRKDRKEEQYASIIL